MGVRGHGCLISSTPAESADSVAAALAVMPGARKVTGVTSVPSWSRVVRPRERPASPTARDRLPGAADLRDLDEVVHEREAGEPGLLGGRGDVAQPRERVARRGSARPGARRRARPPGVRRARPRRRCRAPARRGRRRVDGVTRTTGPSPRPRAGPARRRPRRAGRRGPAPGPGGRGGVARAAQRRQACRARRRRPAARAARACVEPAAAPDGVGAERVDDGGQAPAERGPTTTCSSRAKASAEASRSCSPLPTTPRRASDETTSAAR